MKLTVLLSTVLAVVLFTGCIETQLLVTVNSDGSGDIRETVKMKKAITEMMRDISVDMKASMQEEGADAEAGESEPEAVAEAEADVDMQFFTEEEIREAAAEMGQGVRYVSHEMIDTEEHTGYVAVYAFDDVNTILVNEDPAQNIPDMPGTESEGGAGAEEKVAFSFTPGSPARLVIRIPEDPDEATEEAEAEETPEQETEEENAEGLEQMKEFFRDMRMLLQVRVNGDITGTNASYVDGSTVTVMDVDFNVLLDDEETLKKLQDAEYKGPSGAKELLKNVPGLRVETEKEVTVTFE